MAQTPQKRKGEQVIWGSDLKNGKKRKFLNFGMTELALNILAFIVAIVCLIAIWHSLPAAIDHSLRLYK